MTTRTTKTTRARKLITLAPTTPTRPLAPHSELIIATMQEAFGDTREQCIDQAFLHFAEALEEAGWDILTPETDPRRHEKPLTKAGLMAALGEAACR